MNSIERSIAHLWQGLLGLEQVGVHDNFLELGGNSLLATQALSQLRRDFGVKLSLSSFLEGPTIAQLAAAIGQLKGDEIDLPNDRGEQGDLGRVVRLLGLD
jgi:acyl carrier protein